MAHKTSSRRNLCDISNDAFALILEEFSTHDQAQLRRVCRRILHAIDDRQSVVTQPWYLTIASDSDSRILSLPAFFKDVVHLRVRFVKNIREEEGMANRPTLANPMAKLVWAVGQHTKPTKVQSLNIRFEYDYFGWREGYDIMKRDPGFPYWTVMCDSLRRFSELRELHLDRVTHDNWRYHSVLHTRLLRQPTAFPHLRKLSVTPTPGLEYSGITELDDLRELQQLNLAHCCLCSWQTSLTHSLIRWLTEAQRFPNLLDLNLRDSGLDKVGGIEFTSSIHFPAIQRLDLSRNQILHHSVIRLAGSPIFGQLKWLDISETYAGRALQAIADSPHLGNLETLISQCNMVTKREAIALARSTRLPSLTFLDLSRNNIGREGADALNQTTAFPRMQQLIL